MGTLGVFGGTFDPLHIGHLILAKEACYQLNFDQILWVLTPNPPHKPDQRITDPALRLKMLRSALEKEPEFVFSEVELKREPPHYTYDTMEILRQQYPGQKLICLLGGDSMRDFHTWYRASDLAQRIDGFGVMLRPNASFDLEELEERFPGLKAKIQIIQAPLLQISSSDIRQRIQEGRPYRYFLTSPVYELIQEQDLYRGDA
jgi:nicotinate-nucleotide adenylyltransferase